MIVQGGIGNGESKIERNDDRSGVLLLYTADYIGKKLNHERGITYRHFITSHRKVIAQQDKRSITAVRKGRHRITYVHFSLFFLSESAAGPRLPVGSVPAGSSWHRRVRQVTCSLLQLLSKAVVRRQKGRDGDRR